MTKKRLIIAAIAVLIVVCIKKAASQREAEWHGLTESQARAKLDAKLPSRIPDEKRSEISDKVVGKMRDRGVIRQDSDVSDESAEMTDTVDLRESTGEAAELAH